MPSHARQHGVDGGNIPALYRFGQQCDEQLLLLVKSQLRAFLEFRIDEVEALRRQGDQHQHLHDGGREK